MEKMVLKTASKPIASMLKNQARRHLRFRQFIIDVGQGYRRFTTTMQRSIDDHRTDVEIRPLNEEKASQAASGSIGGLLVFPVAALVIICEMQRRESVEAELDEMVEQRCKIINEKRDVVEQKLKGLEQKLNEMEQLARGKRSSRQL